MYDIADYKCDTIDKVFSHFDAACLYIVGIRSQNLEQ